MSGSPTDDLGPLQNTNSNKSNINSPLTTTTTTTTKVAAAAATTTSSSSSTGTTTNVTNPAQPKKFLEFTTPSPTDEESSKTHAAKRTSPSNIDFLSSLKKFKVDGTLYKHYGHQSLMHSQALQNIINNDSDNNNNSNNNTNINSGGGNDRAVGRVSSSSSISNTKSDQTKQSQEPRTAWTRDQLNQKLSKVLDIKLEDNDLPWPYNTENLQSLINLQIEKEKTKQLETQKELNDKTKELLSLAKDMHISGDLIPYIFASEYIDTNTVAHSTDRLQNNPSAFISNLVHTSHGLAQGYTATNINRHHSDTQLPSFSETTQNIKAASAFVSPVRSPDKLPILTHRRVVSDSNSSESSMPSSSVAKPESTPERASLPVPTSSTFQPRIDLVLNRTSPSIHQSKRAQLQLQLPVMAAGQYTPQSLKSHYYATPQAIPPPPMPHAPNQSFGHSQGPAHSHNHDENHAHNHAQYLPQPPPPQRLGSVPAQSTNNQTLSPYSPTYQVVYQQGYPPNNNNHNSISGTSSNFIPQSYPYYVNTSPSNGAPQGYGIPTGTLIANNAASAAAPPNPLPPHHLQQQQLLQQLQSALALAQPPPPPQPQPQPQLPQHERQHPSASMPLHPPAIGTTGHSYHSSPQPIPSQAPALASGAISKTTTSNISSASSNTQKHKVPSHHFESPDSSKGKIFMHDKDNTPPSKKPRNSKNNGGNINFMITTPKNPPARKYNNPHREKKE